MVDQKSSGDDSAILLVAGGKNLARTIGAGGGVVAAGTALAGTGIPLVSTAGAGIAAVGSAALGTASSLATAAGASSLAGGISTVGAAGIALGTAAAPLVGVALIAGAPLYLLWWLCQD